MTQRGAPMKPETGDGRRDRQFSVGSDEQPSDIEGGDVMTFAA
jgi:hypothetical protein